ncbi:MAG: methylated-DNA--[protein]-cysteine S-methyltransferase [Pseudomonadota bacterium]
MTPSESEHSGSHSRSRRRVAAMEKACRQIERAEEMPDLDQLADEVHMSRFHFQRTFKAVVGVTPRSYWEAQRQERMRDKLATGADVARAALDAGFGSPARFYAGAGASLGMTPGTYRAGGPGEVIHFAVGRCSLGSILVAETERGVCAISLGDDPQELVDALARRFSKAQLVGADASFESRIAQIVGLLEHSTPAPELPLDIRGTAFQQQVWQVLRDIPSGATLSYAEVAKKMGRPKASRAVAAACAANPLALVIPCHRVVRSDGALSGYRWGVERKAELLRREAAG